MGNIDQQFTDLANRIGDEFNTLRENEIGARSNLLTAAKTTLVAAINEIYALAGGGSPNPGGDINDLVTSTAKTWSSVKLLSTFPVLNDAAVTGTDTWSSQRIAQAIADGGGGGGAGIDDVVIAPNKTWSSQKINADLVTNLAAALAAAADLIDDGAASLSQVWSSARTANAINDAVALIPPSAQIDDGAISASSVWSSDKTNAAIQQAVASIDKTSLGLSNVENKSSAQIRGELTALNVTTALGLSPTDTPPLVIRDEGILITSRALSVNFTGGGVTAADDGSGNVTVTTPIQDKTSLGLGAVENKSSATIRSEITSGNVTSGLGFTPLSAAEVGTSVAPLVGGFVPVAYIPGAVDNVDEFNSVAEFPATGLKDRIYIVVAGVDIDKQYRWSGTNYRQIVSSPGTTDAVTEGVLNKYFTESRVLTTVLAGLSVATNAAATAADTILSGVGKLQAQCTALGARITALTKTDIGLDQVENKSGATIRSELTAGEVNDALGFTPGSGGPVVVRDEGTQLTTAVSSINFVGNGVAATTSGTAVTVTVTQAAIADTDALPQGATNLYYTDTKVRAALLTGLSLVSAAAITAADSVLGAFGKLQKQITDLTAAAVTLTGVATLTNKTLDNATFIGIIENGTTGTAGSFPIGYNTTDLEFTTVSNITLTFSAAPQAGRSGTVLIKNTGAHTHIFAAGAGGVIKWIGGTQPASTAINGKWDMYVWKCDRAGTAFIIGDGGRNI